MAHTLSLPYREIPNLSAIIADSCQRSAPTCWPPRPLYLCSPTTTSAPFPDSPQHPGLTPHLSSGRAFQTPFSLISSCPSSQFHTASPGLAPDISLAHPSVPAASTSHLTSKGDRSFQSKSRHYPVLKGSTQSVQTPRDTMAHHVVIARTLQLSGAPGCPFPHPPLAPCPRA